MKKWKLLFNPFTRVAGWQALTLGLVIVALSGLIGTYTHVLFDGVLDAHITDKAVSFKTPFVLLAIDVACIVAVMYVAGIIISRQTRFIDILGTMILARTPMLLIAILGVLVTPVSTEEILQNPMSLFGNPSFMLFTLFSIPLLVWFIVLMYNALKVSTGKKGATLISVFIVGLIVAEVLSKILIYSVMK